MQVVGKREIEIEILQALQHDFKPVVYKVIYFIIIFYIVIDDTRKNYNSFLVHDGSS